MSRDSFTARGTLSLDRNNSFMRRTVSRTVNNTTVTHKDVTDPDFINVITAIEELYAQPDVMEMQQLDGRTREQVGQGGVFCVSTVNAESTQPSQIAADTIIRHTQDVIVKQLPTKLFDANGLAVAGSHGAASKFVMELRILSNPVIRSNDSIIRLLGIGWEYTRSELTAPEPNLLLERAHGTLRDFLKDYPNLPIETKTAISLDTAKGIAALHSCGIVHGDIKTENVLMVESTRWVAKVADFSHSMLDTGDPAKLLGGTPPFNAPEWERKLSSAGLYKTDVFSFGLVLGCVFVGTDIFEKFTESKRHGLTFEACKKNFEEMKTNENLREYVTNLLYEIDDTDLASRREDISSTRALLDLSLHEDPNERDLGQIISKLSRTREEQPAAPPETIISRLDTNIIAIPYQALNNTSQILKSHVMKALETTANKLEDERNPTACYELCICYFSGFGTATNYVQATAWLMKACEREQPWARASVHRLLEAMQTSATVQNFPVEDWLMSVAQQGSLIALESLQERNSPGYSRALAAYRKSGLNTSKAGGIHWPAISAKLTLSGHPLPSPELEVLLDSPRNAQKDTLLICATREGRHHVVHQLLDRGANARICNSLGENALHLLSCLDPQEVETVAGRLFRASVDWTTEAHGSSISRTFEQRPTVAGCPLVRAAAMNRPFILKILFRLETQHETSPTFRQRKIKEANLRKMLAIACRQCYIDVIETIFEHRPEIMINMNTLGFWIDQRRYSLCALAIASCVSVKATSGFNVPEKFWRAHAHGRAYLENLTRTLHFLRCTGMDFQRTACGGDSNALFFAIRLGRAETVKFLLEGYVVENMFAAFGTAMTTTAAAPHPNHHEKIGLVSAISLSIAQGHRDIFKLLLRTRDGEALKMGIEYPVIFRAAETWRIPHPHTFHPKAMDVRVLFPGVEYNVYRSDDCWLIPWPKKNRDHFYFSDGRLNYPLKYMTDIASSVHRDIALSKILFDELRKIGNYDPHSWVPRNYLESCCLGTAPALHSPLEAAAVGLWPALVRTLVENGASPWAKKYWIYQDHRNPYCTFIISDMLTADDKTPQLKHRLQGARYLLAKTTDMRDKLCPKTVDDLHSLLITSSNMLDAHEEIAALWSEIYEMFRVLPSLPRDRKIKRRYHHQSYDKEKQQVHETYNRGLVYVSAQKRNASALECFLRLGFSVNGSLWNRLTLTPYDTVRGGTSVTGDGDGDEAQCMKMLQDRGAHRGLFYLVEFQILLTVITFYLLVRLMIKDIPFFLYTMRIFPEVPGVIKEAWGDGIKGEGMPVPVWLFVPLFLVILCGACSLLFVMSVVSLLPLVIPALYIFTTLLSLGRTVPKWFLEHDKCPWWVSKKSNTAIILHILPWIWLGALMMNDVDYEAVQAYMYGPTVALIWSLHERNARKRPVATPQQPTIEATEASNDVAVEHPESTFQQDRFPRQSFKQGLDKFINGSIHSMSSVPRAVAALTHRLANRRSLRGYGRSRPFYHDEYRDDDDDDAELRSLLRSEDFDDDDAHELA